MAEMNLTAAKRWLVQFLEGREPTANELRDLAGECAGEDLNLEYKSGREFDDKEKARQTLRECVCAFANSDGGTLVVGYHQQTGVFDGARVPGGKLGEWLPRTLGPMVQFLHPPPRTFTVEMELGIDALVIVVARSSYLVRVDVSGGAAACYIRVGDSNFPPEKYRNTTAPDWLFADLQLGRRNRPILDVEVADKVVVEARRDQVGNVVQQGVAGLAGLRIRVPMRVENVGFVYAEDVRIGAVTRVVRMEHGSRTPPAASLLGAVDDIGAEEWFAPFDMPRHHVLTQRDDFEKNLRAFAAMHQELVFHVPVVPPTPGAMPQDPSEWAKVHGWGLLFAAVYVVARNSPALWYELRIAHTGATQRDSGPPHVLWHAFSPPVGMRPRMGWRFLRQDEEARSDPPPDY